MAMHAVTIIYIILAISEDFWLSYTECSPCYAHPSPCNTGLCIPARPGNDPQAFSCLCPPHIGGSQCETVGKGKYSCFDSAETDFTLCDGPACGPSEDSQCIPGDGQKACICALGFTHAADDGRSCTVGTQCFKCQSYTKSKNVTCPIEPLEPTSGGVWIFTEVYNYTFKQQLSHTNCKEGVNLGYYSTAELAGGGAWASHSCRAEICATGKYTWSCLSPGGACSTNFDCCSDTCLANNTCSCMALGDTCSTNSDCCYNICLGNNTCGCLAPGDACSTNSDCCSDTCLANNTCSCMALGEACSTNPDCCSNLCLANNTCSCLSEAASCSLNSECCDDDCRSGACCLRLGTSCSLSTECCSNYCSYECCYSGAGRVTLEDGTTRKIADLNVGDRVQSVNTKGKISYMPVGYLFHKNDEDFAVFVGITTENGNYVEISHEHYIPVMNNPHNVANFTYVYAEEVKIGNFLLTINQKDQTLQPSRVTNITPAYRQGFYSPRNNDYTMVVNDILTHTLAAIDKNTFSKWTQRDPWYSSRSILLAFAYAFPELRMADGAHALDRLRQIIQPLYGESWSLNYKPSLRKLTDVQQIMNHMVNISENDAEIVWS